MEMAFLGEFSHRSTRKYKPVEMEHIE